MARGVKARGVRGMVAAGIKAIVRFVTDYALPPRCPGCGTIVTGDHQFCLDCWGKLEFVGQPSCATCQLPLPDGALDGDQCAPCLSETPPFDGVRAAVVYNETSGAIVMRLKYGRRTGHAALIAQSLRSHLPDDAGEWTFLPVPLHASRLWQRGFNQSLLIAKHLAGPIAAEVRSDLLLRRKRTRPLRGMSGKQRAAEVKSVFALNPAHKGHIKGKKIILVDDVFTTGATVRACAKILKRGGADSVLVFCWARVVPGRERLDLDGWPSDMGL